MNKILNFLEENRIVLWLRGRKRLLKWSKKKNLSYNGRNGKFTKFKITYLLKDTIKGEKLSLTVTCMHGSRIMGNHAQLVGIYLYKHFRK